MISFSSLKQIATICLAAALLAGCSRSPRVVYYTLNATAAPETATQALEAVVIGQVTLPELLDRPQFVVTVDANRVDILEMQRWAAPLKSEIPRIIAANLAALLQPTRVAAYPQNAGLDAAYRIQLYVQRFAMTEGKGVDLDFLWSVHGVNGDTLQSGRATFSETVTTSGYEALVAAQSRVLAAVSRELAQALLRVAVPANMK